MELEFFESVGEAVSYVTNELRATLADDLGNMEGRESSHYDDDDREDMQGRINDIDTVTPLIEAAPDLLAALKTMREKYGRLHDALSDCIESGRLNAEILPNDYAALVEMTEACVGADHQAEAAIVTATGA
ncbi:hypothetical protein [Collimonas humicola]|uniref:hypothetical protein n=1 Tax=Collimonas humicola TaxID=2825886 RepID=UPI001B8BF007|nr:hypothetical protein [Collimonas humicola]